MDHLVLTVIAPDQPGLVERIAQCIAAHGGNWLESRMARLANKFAGLLLVSVPEGRADALVAAGAEFRRRALIMQCRLAEGASREPDLRPFEARPLPSTTSDPALWAPILPSWRAACSSWPPMWHRPKPTGNAPALPHGWTSWPRPSSSASRAGATTASMPATRRPRPPSACS